MTPQTERRAIAFINTIASRCTSCLRRNTENCRGCLSAWANSIMRDYENDQKSSIDVSAHARMLFVIDALKKADRPLFSNEFRMQDLCSRQLKYWTLRKMVQKGLIGCERTDNCGTSMNRYFLRKTRKTKNENRHS